ncbi:MAG: Asp-tRNA(Asn)/Glu-tRNA(Gln) amidotransferase subunit GatA [Minisyncoccia bacterium]
MFLHDLTIRKINNGLLTKEFSALELVQNFFDYIKYKDKEIGAYLLLLEKNALQTAENVDIALAKGEGISLLSGVPLAVKDNILIKGTKTTAASKILQNYIAAYNATVIDKLQDKKAIFIGKTNMDEFAMGSSTETSAFQITHNPYDLQRVPGGSSGGSAAAVASGMAVAALGSDTGGSIRQPAAFCGVVGLKPTYGAVSRNGLIAMASSLDQIGPITKTVEDAALLFEAINGNDDFDATTVDDYKYRFSEPKLEELRQLTIGLPKEYFINGLDKDIEKEINNAVNKIKSLKINFKEISLPHTSYALSVYYIIMPAEASTNLARYDGIRYARPEENFKDLNEIYFTTKGLGFGSEVKRRILLGTFVLSAGYYDAYYNKAQKVRRLIKNDFDRAFENVDIILTPVTPTKPFKLGEKTKDPLSMYLSDIFTIPANLASLPALSLPVKKYNLTRNELPVGFQLIGKKFHEKDILDLGIFYEKLESN